MTARPHQRGVGQLCAQNRRRLAPSAMRPQKFPPGEPSGGQPCLVNLHQPARQWAGDKLCQCPISAGGQRQRRPHPQRCLRRRQLAIGDQNLPRKWAVPVRLHRLCHRRPLCDLRCASCDYDVANKYEFRRENENSGLLMDILLEFYSTGKTFCTGALGRVFYHPCYAYMHGLYQCSRSWRTNCK